MDKTNENTDFAEKCALLTDEVFTYCMYAEPEANEDGTEDLVTHVFSGGAEVFTDTERL